MVTSAPADPNPIIEADFIKVTAAGCLILFDKNRKILHAIARGNWRAVSQKMGVKKFDR